MIFEKYLFFTKKTCFFFEKIFHTNSIFQNSKICNQIIYYKKKMKKSLLFYKTDKIIYYNDYF